VVKPGLRARAHRIGGLAKDALTGTSATTAHNHETMVSHAQREVMRLQEVRADEVYGDAGGDVL